MTRYTELENIAINIVLDTSLEILTMLLPSSSDDDERLSLLVEYFNAAYEQRADVCSVPQNCKDLLHKYIEAMSSNDKVFRSTVE